MAQDEWLREFEMSAEAYWNRLENINMQLMEQLNHTEKDIFNAGVSYHNTSEYIANSGTGDKGKIEDLLNDLADDVQDIIDHLE